jgi:hypothetical protein
MRIYDEGLWRAGAWLAAGILAAAAPAAELQNHLTLSRIALNYAPAIDGALDDACWKQAKVITGFMALNNKPATADTRVRMCYDDRNLYIAWQCMEPNAGGVRAAAERKGDIWAKRDDVVAVFIKPDNRLSTYYQFAATPRGILFDQRNSQTETGLYSPVVKTKAVTGKDCWIVEMAIPFAALGVAEEMANVWRMDFCRYRAQDKEYSAWCNRTGNWHNLDQLGFVRGIVIEQAGADQGGVALNAVRLDHARYFATNAMELALENRTAQPIQGDLVLEIVSPSGQSRQFKRNVALPPGRVSPVSVDYVLLPEEGFHAAAFTLGGPQGALYVSPKANLDAGELLDVFVGRDFYTDEPQGKVIVDLGNLGEERTRLSYEVKVTEGTRLVQTASGQPTGARSTAAIDLKGLKDGTYRVDATLLDPSGRPLGVRERNLVKRPKRAGEVKVDRERDCLIVDDRPFFPIGLYYSDEIYGTDRLRNTGHEYAFRDLQGSGFNTMIMIFFSEGYNGQTREENTAFLDLCRKYGIKMLYDVSWGYYGRALPPRTTEEGRKAWLAAQSNVLARLTQDVPFYGSHPAVFGYYNWDEGGASIADIMRNIYETVRAADPCKPVWYTPCQLLSVDDSFDIWGPDVYRPPLQIASAMEVNKLMVRQQYPGARHKPMFVVPPVSFAGGLAPAQNRCQTYLSLIHGARGVIYYQYRGMNPASWEATRQLSREMQALSPALLTPAVDQQIGAGVDSPIEALVRVCEGDVYLLTVNTRKAAAVNARFAFEGLTDGCKVREFFEQRDLPVRGNAFADEFAAWASHVYVIRGLGAKEPYRLTLECREKPVPPPARKRKAPPAPSKTVNLILDSSVEASTTDGWPVFWEMYWHPSFPPARFDRTTAVDGNQSLVLDYPSDGSITADCYGQYHDSKLDPAKPYTFSIYLKAAKETQVMLRCGSYNHPHEVTVGTEWKRHVFTERLDKESAESIGPLIMIAPKTGGRIWIDALQCEEGAQATPYTEDRVTREYWAGFDFDSSISGL